MAAQQAPLVTPAEPVVLPAVPDVTLVTETRAAPATMPEQLSALGVSQASPPGSRPLATSPGRQQFSPRGRMVRPSRARAVNRLRGEGKASRRDAANATVDRSRRAEGTEPKTPGGIGTVRYARVVGIHRRVFMTTKRPVCITSRWRMTGPLLYSVLAKGSFLLTVSYRFMK